MKWHRVIYIFKKLPMDPHVPSKIFLNSLWNTVIYRDQKPNSSFLKVIALIGP